MMQKKLMEKFGNHINHMSCVYLHDGENCLRHFLEKLKPLKEVIEIGTYQGVSACILAEYAEKVYTFDIEKQKLTDDIISFAGNGKVKAFIVKNRKTEAEDINKILDKNKVDLVFIDGEHFHGELEKDYEMVKDFKTILVHDYHPDFKEVYDFCNGLKYCKLESKGTFCLLTKKEDAKKEIKPKKRIKSGRAKK